MILFYFILFSDLVEYSNYWNYSIKLSFRRGQFSDWKTTDLNVDPFILVSQYVQTYIVQSICTVF